jgi:hypothetical protein
MLVLITLHRRNYNDAKTIHQHLDEFKNQRIATGPEKPFIRYAMFDT